MINKVSIIIPNWNGKAFLSRCVAAILQSAVEYGKPFECLLMDDASTDDSAFEVARQFPEVRLIRHDINRGFGHMVNDGARQATGDVLLLVNNDLIARGSFVRNLCHHFEDSNDLFGVSGKTVDWDNDEPNHVNMRGCLENGTLQLTWSDDASTTETMFLQGGSCAVRRDLFTDFGGFSPLFAPGYWEDYDMSYQALKAGYRNLYEPAATGSHLGQGSMIRAHGHDRIEFVRTRNRHLLLALNLTDPAAYNTFWREMPQYIRSGTDARFKHRFGSLRYLLTHRNEILAERKRRSKYQTTTDAEIFARFEGLGLPCK